MKLLDAYIQRRTERLAATHAPDLLCPYCHRLVHHPACTEQLRTELDGGRGGSTTETPSPKDRRVVRCKERGFS